MKSRKMPFVKVESLRNDFIISDDSTRRWTSHRAAAICDRRLGVGADGLVVLGPYVRDGIRFRLFNADGSRAEWSGNGARGTAAYLAAMNPKKREFHLLTGAGCVQVNVHRRPQGGVDVDFTRPMPVVDQLAMTRIRSLMNSMRGKLVSGPVAVDAGNPHWIFTVRGFDFAWEKVGESCQSLNRGTRGMNVEFVRVITPQRIELRIYERGVGPTLSSGTGALASLAACDAQKLVSKRVLVEAPGGSQNAVISEDGERIALSAPARIVMAGVWSEGR